MQIEKKTFAYRIYKHFTQQWGSKAVNTVTKFVPVIGLQMACNMQQCGSPLLVSQLLFNPPS